MKTNKEVRARLNARIEEVHADYIQLFRMAYGYLQSLPAKIDDVEGWAVVDEDAAQLAAAQLGHEVMLNIQQMRELEKKLTEPPADLSHMLWKCESPIEQMLLIELYFIKPTLMEIEQQITIKNTRPYSDESFRIDFVISLCFDPENGVCYPLFGVECDGRNFHESHEQIQRDKRRDRILTTAGLQILRFTGSEIYKDSGLCAREVTRLFLQKVEELIVSFIKERTRRVGEDILWRW